MTKRAPHKIFKYFSDLLEFNKLTFLRDRAIEEMVAQFSGIIESVDKDKGIVRYWKPFYDEISDNYIEGLEIYDFYKDHKTELFKNSESLIENIDESIYLNADNDSNKSLLQKFSKELFYLLSKAEKIYPNYQELNQALKSIENHLLLRYQIQPYALKITNEKLSYFGFKDTLSRSVFQELYDLADRLELIEYDVVEEQIFLEVFLENPSNPHSVIRFNCENGLIITLLERLRPYFTSLNPKTIEKSKRFITKQGLVLSESNYNTSHKRLKEKPTQKTNILNQQLDEVLS